MARLCGRLRKRRCRVRKDDIVRIEPWSSFATNSDKADIIELLPYGSREARAFDDKAEGANAADKQFFDFGSEDFYESI